MGATFGVKVEIRCDRSVRAQFETMMLLRVRGNHPIGEFRPSARGQEEPGEAGGPPRAAA